MGWEVLEPIVVDFRSASARGVARSALIQEGLFQLNVPAALVHQSIKYDMPATFKIKPSDRRISEERNSIWI